MLFHIIWHFFNNELYEDEANHKLQDLCNKIAG